VKPFCVLVGPNASGKTNFLDILSLLGDLMSTRGDVAEALSHRGGAFQDLVWQRRDTDLQLSVEATFPQQVRDALRPENAAFTALRYDIAIGIDESDEVGLNRESLYLIGPPLTNGHEQRDLFPEFRHTSEDIDTPPKKFSALILNKALGGNDEFFPEGKSTYKPSFKLGRSRSALANLPADRESFPAGIWFRELLEKGIQEIVLNSQKIRQPSPPGLGKHFQATGENLPWVIESLRNGNPARFQAWLEHVKTALPDLLDIRTIERPEDKHRYISVHYATGAVVPSWAVSDGTLRLLALTIAAYLPPIEGIFLIEEPENGIHPRAIETIFQSLESMYEQQVLVATHSPIALAMIAPENVLCFAKDKEGATDIVFGNHHPALRNWNSGDLDIGTLFAAGILS